MAIHFRLKQNETFTFNLHVVFTFPEIVFAFRYLLGSHCTEICFLFFSFIHIASSCIYASIVFYFDHHNHSVGKCLSFSRPCENGKNGFGNRSNERNSFANSFLCGGKNGIYRMLRMLLL